MTAARSGSFRVVRLREGGRGRRRRGRRGWDGKFPGRARWRGEGVCEPFVKRGEFLKRDKSLYEI